jgi:cell division protein FtsB
LEARLTAASEEGVFEFLTFEIEMASQTAAALQAENAALRAEIAALRPEIAALRAEIAALRAEIAAL